MGPEGVRSFRAVFAGSVLAVLIGLCAGTIGAAAAARLETASPGWTAFSAALLGIMLLTPPLTARLMGVGNHHLTAGYVFALACGSALLFLGIAYVALIPLTPTVVAGASVAGIRFSEWNEE